MKEIFGLDDSEFNIPVFSPICSYCIHANWSETRCCKAFPEPEGIPLEIWNGENNHMAPFTGDHGIQFERVVPSK